VCVAGKHGSLGARDELGLSLLGDEIVELRCHPVLLMGGLALAVLACGSVPARETSDSEDIEVALSGAVMKASLILRPGGTLHIEQTTAPARDMRAGGLRHLSR
jgi:hypothetical protein